MLTLFDSHVLSSSKHALGTSSQQSSEQHSVQPVLQRCSLGAKPYDEITRRTHAASTEPLFLTCYRFLASRLHAVQKTMKSTFLKHELQSSACNAAAHFDHEQIPLQQDTLRIERYVSECIVDRRTPRKETHPDMLLPV